jgi:hypothetical protein
LKILKYNIILKENCEEINTDWIDDKNDLFISFVAVFGKDFGIICHCVHSRTEVQYNMFFITTCKWLELDEFINRNRISQQKEIMEENEEIGIQKNYALLWDTNSFAKV